MDRWLANQRDSSSLNRFHFSYTMNGYVKGGGELAGCGSTYKSSCSSGAFVTRKLSSIRRPTEKIMLAEEPVSTRDIPEGFSTYADDGRWAPPANTITTRHSKRGNANFADGHAKPVDAKFAKDPLHYDTTY